MTVLRRFVGRRLKVSKNVKACGVLLCFLCYALVDYRQSTYSSFKLPSHEIESPLANGAKDYLLLKKDTFPNVRNTQNGINTKSSVSKLYSLTGIRWPSNPVLFIVVCSHPENIQLRQTIRSTWGNDVKQLKDIQMAFLLGDTGDDSWREIGRREMSLHGDIIRVDVAEGYRNLTHKVVKGMDWIVRNVPSFQYYMKCDDDVFVNVQYLLRQLRQGVIGSRQILGALNVKSQVVRDPRDQWSVPYDVFPKSTFPPYVSGGGYVMARPVIPLLLDAAKTNISLVPVEDVFITGILAQKAEITLVGHPGFSYWTSGKATPCDIITQRKITSVNMAAPSIRKLYTQVNSILSAQNGRRCQSKSPDVSESESSYLP